jgi:hypothetical protein
MIGIHTVVKEAMLSKSYSWASWSSGGYSWASNTFRSTPRTSYRNNSKYGARSSAWSWSKDCSWSWTGSVRRKI